MKDYADASGLKASRTNQCRARRGVLKIRASNKAKASGYLGACPRGRPIEKQQYYSQLTLSIIPNPTSFNHDRDGIDRNRGLETETE